VFFLGCFRELSLGDLMGEICGNPSWFFGLWFPSQIVSKGARFWGFPSSRVRGSWLGSSPVHSCLLCCFFTSCFMGFHLPTFSSTSLLSLLLLPLDVLALSHFHAPLPNMPPLYSFKTKPWLPPHACTLHVVW
jgi:hypothetical protein